MFTAMFDNISLTSWWLVISFRGWKSSTEKNNRGTYHMSLYHIHLAKCKSLQARWWIYIIPQDVET